MRNFSLALAGVVAGSLALSASGTTTTNTWWSETFTYQDGDLTSLTNQTYAQDLFKGVWEPGVGDTSSISNGVLALNTEGTDLKFTPNPYDGSEIPTNHVIVDANVFFVGSDTEPNLGGDSDIQFALFLKVPDGEGQTNVMVYVRDVTGSTNRWVALNGTALEDKSWHHVQVEIDYGKSGSEKVAKVYIDGDQKTATGDDLVLANVNGADYLHSVSFKGTGAVDNFVGNLVAESAPVQHTFTASAYVNGSLDTTIEIDSKSGANGGTVTFEIAREAGGVPIDSIKVKGLEGASDVTYTAANSFSGLVVDDTDPDYLFVDVPISGAADATSEYALLEVYYASAASTTYTATITLPAGCTLTGVKVNNVAQDPLPSLPMTVNDGDVVEFTYTNADGVSKTKTVPVSGADVTATTEAFTWADYLGAAVDGAYEIDNLAELKLFQKGVANTNDLTTANTTFKLTADIALDAPWPGIGVQNGKDIYSTADFNAAAFQGTFDGQNHTISGFQMVGVAGNPKNNGEGLDYCGFFNSTYGATIQNLKIAYAGSLFAADTTSSTMESGATFVGVAKNSTLRNLTTVAGTVSCSKGFGGIVGFLTSGTSVDSCTNNLNMTSLAKNKCGGIAMITQGGSAVTISNCQNNGTQTTSSANSEYGAIVGYVGLDTTIANCETTVGRFLKHQTGTVTLQGVNKGDARVLAYDGTATPGLNFATVDGNVATFVADGALALNGEYKVMATGATATFAFAEAGTIAFDTALATPTYAITAPGFDLTDATEGTVKTYTAAVPAPVTWTITFNDYDSTQLFVTNDVADNATGYGPATDPTREGYAFVGWTNSVAGGATYATANLPAATADATYTAVYEEEVAPVTPAVDIGGGLAGYTPAPGKTVPPPVAIDNNGFNASFVAPVAGYYCLMTASTPSGDDADYAVVAGSARYVEKDALVTLTDSNTSATSKFYKIGYSATEIK